jgi:hypothetical protein
MLKTQSCAADAEGLVARIRFHTVGAPHPHSRFHPDTTRSRHFSNASSSSRWMACQESPQLGHKASCLSSALIHRNSNNEAASKSYSIHPSEQHYDKPDDNQQRINVLGVVVVCENCDRINDQG